MQPRLLLLKLGSNRETRPIIENLRARIGHCFIAGVEESLDVGESVYDEVITSHDDALFGAYTKFHIDDLAMTPELYAETREFEGQLLRMLDRIRYHDQSEYRHARLMSKYDNSFVARTELAFRHIIFWDYVIRTYQFDAVISQNFGHLGWDFAALSLCRRRQIPTLIFHDAGQFPGLQYVQESVENLGDLELGRSLKLICSSMLLAETPERASVHLTRLTGESQATDPFHSRLHVAQGKEFKTGVIAAVLNNGDVRKQVASMSSLVRAISGKTKRLTRHPRRTIVRSLETLSRMKLTRKSMREERSVWTKAIPEQPFVYMPLHFQPEGSTSAKGRHYVDQREAVAMVASSLPPDWLLVVKEHPHQWRRLYERPNNYWIRIAGISRVRVVPHHYENRLLTIACRAVVSISHSTIATEAWAMGKQVVFLGDTHLRDAPGVTCPHTADDLRRIWVEPEQAPTRAQLKNYLRRVEDSTIEGVLYGRPSYLTDSEYQVTVHRTRHNITEMILAWLSTKGLTNYPSA